MSIFIQSDQKNRQFLIPINLSSLGLGNYLYKMAATAGPSSGEVGNKCSQQQFSCFLRSGLEIIGC